MIRLVPSDIVPYLPLILDYVLHLRSMSSFACPFAIRSRVMKDVCCFGSVADDVFCCLGLGFVALEAFCC